MNQQYICKTCGSIGDPIKIAKSGLWLGIILLILAPPFGLFILIYRQATKYYGCEECGSEEMLPTSTPIGQKLSSEQNIQNSKK